MSKTKTIDEKLKELKKINDKINNKTDLADKIYQNYINDKSNKLNINQALYELDQDQQKKVIKLIHKELLTKTLEHNIERTNIIKKINMEME